MYVFSNSELQNVNNFNYQLRKKAKLKIESEFKFNSNCNWMENLNEKKINLPELLTASPSDIIPSLVVKKIQLFQMCVRVWSELHFSSASDFA
ncbi:hypothetical protein T4D_11962 [Trichinella pseudospiralis]|uniref:Uncharacterized protein n=1 Tax=Trichinella pseudospiralis TaxID=6337 RepID=A0A0V1G544_TRIPS|nr:hypothetical protein T4D_11962 [Trichinella pseudospiralis]